MNITKEETGKLTASIRVDVTQDDYSGKVEKILRDHQRKASMPGFRPGKVPYGLIKKMYGKSVMLDEINQMLAESLNRFIQENNLHLIGNPLPNPERSTPIEAEGHRDYEFYFDIGLAPDVEVSLTDKMKVEYLEIKASEKMVDEYVEDIRHRYATPTPQEGGKEEHDHGHHVHAELNEELFRKVFPMDDIKDEAGFRNKIREGIERSLEKESDRHFMNTVIEKLVDETSFDLPDEFIKKLLKENSGEDPDENRLAGQFDNFSKSVRWQLIENKLSKDHGLKVEEGEMRDVVRNYFGGQLYFPPGDEEAEKRMNHIIDSVMTNKEEAGRIHDQLFEKKMLELFRSKVKIKRKAVDYDEFIKIVTQKVKPS